MNNTYPIVDQSHTTIPSFTYHQERGCDKCVWVVLGIIILIGSLIASGLLHSRVGNWSLAIGAGGLVVGSVLSAIGLNCSCQTMSQPREKVAFFFTRSDYSMTKVAMQASDILLPETWPEISPQCDISETNCLSQMDIYKYIRYLASKFPEIAALDFQQLYRWSCRKYSIDELKEYIFNDLLPQFEDSNHLNLPLYLQISENHWTLVYINRNKRTVEYYDSLAAYGNYENIKQKLRELANELSQKEPDGAPYQFVAKINKPIQRDSYQCVPWILYCLESTLIDPDFDVNQLDIDMAQKVIARFRLKIKLVLNEMLYSSLPSTKVPSEK